MKHLLYIIMCIALLCPANMEAKDVKAMLVPVGVGYSNTSVNATIFRKNSVVSQHGWQFVAYYDQDGYMTIGKRRLKDNYFVLTRSKYRGNVKDAHNIISIGIDGRGYLHVAFDHHNNRLHYCQSVAPYSAELGDEQPMVGNNEDKVTYPEFYTLRGGDMLFVYRSGKSGQGNLVMNRFDVKTRTWHRVQDVLIDGEQQRNAYWQMCVDHNGVIHLSWVWRETWLVETNHDLCYACSDDGGRTWRKSTGEEYSLPITAANAEYIARIPQSSELMNQTSIAADDHSRPYIASYWKAADDKAPQYKIVYKDAGEWHIQNVGHRTQDFSLSGGGTKMIPMSRPQLAVRSHGSKVEAHYIYRDAETGSMVTIATNDDLLNSKSGESSESGTSGEPSESGKSLWRITTPQNIPVDAWEPSYDTTLWQCRHHLHLFVQRVSQGDGEKVVTTPPQPVYILDADL